MPIEMIVSKNPRTMRATRTKRSIIRQCPSSNVETPIASEKKIVNSKRKMFTAFQIHLFRLHPSAVTRMTKTPQTRKNICQSITKE